MILKGEVSYRAYCPNCRTVGKVIRLQNGLPNVMLNPIWCTSCLTLVKFAAVKEKAEQVYVEVRRTGAG